MARWDDDLGVSFYTDESGKLRMDPETWAYRIAWLDPDTGTYKGPYKKRSDSRGLSMYGGKKEQPKSIVLSRGQVPVHRNFDKVGEWFSDEDLQRMREGYGPDNHEGENNIFSVRRRRRAPPAGERERDPDDLGYTPEEREYLKNSRKWDESGDKDRLGDFLETHLRYWDRPGVVINPLARDLRHKAVLTEFPHWGYSVIGMPMTGYSFVDDSDIGFWDIDERGHPVNDFSEKMRSLYSSGGWQWDDRIGDYVVKGGWNPMDGAVVRNFKQSPFYNEVLTPEQRAMFKDVRSFWELKRRLADLEASELENVIGGPFPRGMIRDSAHGWLRGAKYNPAPRPDGRDFFDSRNPRWRDYMTDKLVEILMLTLSSPFLKGRHASTRDPGNYRLLQVAVPLESLLSNEDVLKGAGTDQRDSMHELVAGEIYPFNEIGDAGELLAEGGPFDRYVGLRIQGVPSDESWHEALGERFGDRDTLISDEEKKEVIKGLKDDVEGMIRQDTLTRAAARR